MAAKTDTQMKNDELTINERLSEFIRKNRRFFLIGLIAIAVILTGFIIFNTVSGHIQSKALTQVDTFERKYNELKTYAGSDEPEAVIKQVEIIVLLTELELFANKTSGFAAARAHCLKADIYAGQKNWAKAEESWTNAAKTAGKSYLVPFSIFNAAVAAEEQGNTEAAIGYYTSALDYGGSFPSAARAQFSVGRLEESRNNKDAALEAYRNLLRMWPTDPVWPNLAQSRILVLSN